jgi:multiple sugar transport system ATP-binding protein
MSDIVLDHVTKKYSDGYEAVKSMDLEIKDGEFMILVGPSGCGKSTALNMIAGLEDISDGELKIGGEVVNSKAPKDRDIAMVFQNYALYPHMTVRENMGFALKLAKVDQKEIDAKVEEAAETLDLTEHLDRKPANLSGGQRQRVAMGRAIVREPSAFLMDEPLSNLDAKLRVQMRTEVAELQSRLGTTTVYVTHDQTEAMTLGDRVAVMRSGLLQQVDTPANLYKDPVNLFVAGFIGSPSMNFVHGAVMDGQVELPFATLPLSDDLKSALGESSHGSDVICGLRPEHFEDAELVGEHLGEGVTFEAKIDLVESMGSELYAYFNAGSDQAEKVKRAASEAGLEELAGGDTDQIVTRLAAESEAKRGENLKLWVDPGRLLLFDPDSGERIRS